VSISNCNCRTFSVAYFLILFVTAFAGTGITQAPVPAHPALLLGTAWYPEQWPESRWESDLALMQQAGIHMVRVGEFAWSAMEPVEKAMAGWMGNLPQLREKLGRGGSRISERGWILKP
jgi:beta-galactosidase